MVISCLGNLLYSVSERVFFHYSNCKVSGIVSLAEVMRRGYPDHIAFDLDKLRWYMLDLTFKCRFKRIISLQELKEYSELADCPY